MSALKQTARRLALATALAFGALVAAPAGIAWAQHDNHGHDPVPAKKADPHAKPAAGHDAHGDAHGGGHHGPGQINWVFGLLGEKEGLTEPDLLFRPKGMPVPFLANILNFSVVAFILFSKAGPAVRQSLIDRREELLRDSEAAAKTKAEALERFNEQKGRIDRIEEEVARIKADYQEQGKRELERIERESKERHERMVREARLLIEQEGRALRQRLLNETIEAATKAAEDQVQKSLNSSDHERLANEYLSQLGSLKAKRGEA